ncbi:thiamine phosphate synthase [Pelagicoccus sp. SDUM812003]|uniref:thiamine phosphate synthase n=1 Tax=Pelagicoccus sp. SDUM812003 TaxID=3041267 RepID=UPI00280FC4B3|nr:thiamine phosphate synthase [Pelagicoccus sp. SDUM812003]MDQ8201745.1 thiamine phosphate synthase [Pelagicoccus sp. SDUM812003]
MNRQLLRLYLVTDFPDRYPNGLLAGVEAALDGGATMVQYRAETGSGRELYETALALRNLLSERGVPLIINNRLDLALAVDADGLHLGQLDLPAFVARRLLGLEKILGLSITAREQLAEVDANAIDYLGVGPVFPTVSKDDAAPALGLEGLREIAKIIDLPIVAIGGIHEDNTSQIMQAGADGIAVVSVFSRNNDPAAVARRLRQRLD